MMTDIAKQTARAQDLTARLSLLYRDRIQSAQDRFKERTQRAYDEHVAPLMAKPTAPWDIWTQWFAYSTDFAQRSILFLDTIRQRGNNFIANEQAGNPPVLHFEYEMLLDARRFERPVNYALVRIIPPPGITVDAKERPYFIIDPRAGQGPGIGGFKDDSEVGVALRAGHPVYFVIFFPMPEPGQTLLDVCDAEARFVRKVRELHPDSPKPAIVGNCQGGWAAMLVAASHPDDTGPIVINGAPMSYWGGAWNEGQQANPMRYAGGLLGGSWLASLMADLGNGLVDGAYSIQNFEYLKPANALWEKYYDLFAGIDTEAPRFLNYDRWWGGFYLFSREEFEWMVQNLFVGNKLATGDLHRRGRGAFDLRAIKSPIILFASLGDNITPAQQAFNWVADVYGSTEEIKARGQTIVGLLDAQAGHLGIFVSGRVATRDHAQIVSVMQSIEALPPGLYGMQIDESQGQDGKVEYAVTFVERRLEDVMARLNPVQRVDEKPFAAVAQIAEFNQRAYELFARPLVQQFANDYTAKLGRDFNPLRLERWALSDLNPWMQWLAPAAGLVKSQRQPVGPEQPFRQVDAMLSELVSASLDYYQALRDATVEVLFYQTYGNLFSLYLEDKPAPAGAAALPPVDPRELPFVREALAAVDQGGYAQALARADCLLAPAGEPLKLAWLNLRQDLLIEYGDLLPELAPDAARRIRGEQEIICHYAPERAIASLPTLLRDPADRQRFLTLYDRLLADPRVQAAGATADQRAIYARIQSVLREGEGGPAADQAGH
jgi:pimeloyl-ACP methyl ester carboxylesterase